MKTYYQNADGIDTGEYFVSTNHPDYQVILEEISQGKALLSEVPKNVDVNPTETWETIRAKRNSLLKQTDWIALPDTVLSNKVMWMTYRAMLRQIPQLYSNPNKVVWPTPPTTPKI